MGEDPKVIMLNDGTDTEVGLAAGADAFLVQLLGGAPSKTGAATLRVVKNASGVPFVAVFIAGKHAGFLSHTDAEGLLPVLADCEEQGAVAAAKAVLAVTTDGTATPVLKLNLASPDRLVTAPTPVATPPVVTPPEKEPLPGRHCQGCGTSLPAEARFCLACGTPVAGTPVPAQGGVAPAPSVRPAQSAAAPASVPTAPMAVPPRQVPRPTQFAKAPAKDRGWWRRQSSKSKALLISGPVAVLLAIVIALVVAGGGGNWAKDIAGVTGGDDSFTGNTQALTGPAATVIASSSTTLSATSVGLIGTVTESTRIEQPSTTEAAATVTTVGETSTTTTVPPATTTTVKPTTSTTKATTTTVAPAGGNGDIIVYITDTGTKYHVEGCQYLAQSKYEVTLAEAKARGFEPCKKCHPPE
jgi:hypothetical protein